MTPAVFISQFDPRSSIMTSQPLSPASSQKPTSRKPTSREAARGPMVLRIPGLTGDESGSNVFLDDMADEGKALWRCAVDGSKPAAAPSAPALLPLSRTAVQRGRSKTNVVSSRGRSTRASTPPPTDKPCLAAHLSTLQGGDVTHAVTSSSTSHSVSLDASQVVSMISHVPEYDRVKQLVQINLRDRTPAACDSLNGSVGSRDDDLATTPRQVTTERSQSQRPQPATTQLPPLMAETGLTCASQESPNDRSIRAVTGTKVFPVPGDHNEYTQPSTAVERKAGSEIVSVLKRTDSGRHRTSSTSGQICRQQCVTLLEPCQSCRSCGGHGSSPEGPQCRQNDGASCAEMRSSSATEDDTPAPARRRISFPMDSVLTAVIQDGDTPELLRILSGRGGPGLVGRTREVGEVVQQRNHAGLTALHHAVLANNLDAAKLLLCHGAAVNAQDVHGFSPLHTAAACGYLSLASLLILFGGDVFCLTAEQELPIDVAKDLPLVRLLGQEMQRVVQDELWLPALLLHWAGRAGLLCHHVLAYLLLLLIHLCLRMRHFWRGHRKTD